MISGFADGELSEQQAAEGRRHLDGCPACAALLTAYRNIAEAAEESLTEPPPDFAAGIMARIKALPAETARGITQKRRRSPKLVVVSLAAAAACIALAFIAAPQMFRFRSPDKASSNEVSAPQAAPMADATGVAGSGESKTASVRVKNASDYSADQAQLTAGAPEAPSPEEREKGDGYASAAGAAPSEQAPSASQFAIQSETEENLEKYYAVISVKGLLPVELTKADMKKNPDGTQSFEITAEKAELLIADGYPAVMGNKNAAAALVIYIPAP
jgi:hypothetical protein